MQFEFATSGRILFGEGKRFEAAKIVAELGTRALLVTGSNPARSEWLANSLEAQHRLAGSYSIPREPTLDRVTEGAAVARSVEADLVVAVGGGSVIDAAKAIAALATNHQPVEHYLEVIGQGQPLSERPLPVVALPSTAGTGAEVTRNAVLSSPEHLLKVSLRSPWLLPAVAIVDPEVTHDLPPDLTAFTGMDALTQLIEPFLSVRANPMTDALCREALPKVAAALPAAHRDGLNRSARTDMSLGSLFGGLALANSGLGAVHGFAAPIGGMFDAPHGAVCAALLPSVLEMNYRAARQHSPNSRILDRFNELPELLLGRWGTMEECIQFLHALLTSLSIPPLRRWGVTASHAADIVQKAAASSSMKGNPVPLNSAELERALLLAI